MVILNQGEDTTFEEELAQDVQESETLRRGQASREGRGVMILAPKIALDPNNVQDRGEHNMPRNRLSDLAQPSKAALRRQLNAIKRELAKTPRKWPSCIWGRPSRFLCGKRRVSGVEEEGAARQVYLDE